ncbi:HNH endonuclease signature motif containing protein [Microbacterium timonense]|uniref:HNH endonuclease signature motif containing protein n=1 Tax=Microbacterium timonense TaxID=2086576 RepID=UPI000D0FA377|nr:HNH endonuclease signature motif containing protein [Microbacterium timonense]
MPFPLADLRDMARMLGDALREPLVDEAQRTLTDHELVETLRVVEELGRWADAARLGLAGEVGRRSEPGAAEMTLTARYGCDSPAELLERAVGVSNTTARARLRTARAVTTCTSLTGQSRPAPLELARQELAAGRLSLDALTTITDGLRPLQRRCSAEDLAAAETELVQAAVGVAGDPPCSIYELRIMAQTWALYLDPDGTLPDEDGERRRTFRLGRRRDDLFPVHGMVTAEVAATLQRLLDAHLNPRVRDRAPRFVEIHASAGPDSPDDEHDDEHVHDPRTADQKRHDALASILSSAASAAESPTLGGAAPTLVVTVADDQLARDDGVAFIDGPDGAVPVSASFARHVGCHGTIQRVALSANGAIKALRVTDRVFSPWQRRAIAARDGGCIIPGCRVRAAWCEIHHVTPWSRRGPTDVGNGVLLCWHHHRSIETSGWEIRMADGVPEVRPPTWLDPRQRWRSANRALHRELQKARLA